MEVKKIEKTKIWTPALTIIAATIDPLFLEPWRQLNRPKKARRPHCIYPLSIYCPKKLIEAFVYIYWDIW